MDQKNNQRFEVISKTPLYELKVGDCISTSDMAIQTDTHLIQMKFIQEDVVLDKKKVKPGIWCFVKTMAGLSLAEQEIKTDDLLETIDNTDIIFKERDKFYNRLYVYEKLAKEPKRSVLLYSIPGCGKSAAINKVIEKMSKEEGVSIIVWDTAKVSSQDISSFFNQSAEFVNVKKFLLIIEDIGGGTVENYGGSRSVDSSLLNLLDGIGRPFQGIPTFIIATTNNPEQTVGALIDRPGRFDKVIELKTPSEKETEALLAFIGKRDLVESDKKAAKKAASAQFSIAHLQEVVVRSMIEDTDYLTVVEQLIQHKAKFKNAFQNVKPLGVHANWED